MKFLTAFLFLLTAPSCVAVGSKSSSAPEGIKKYSPYQIGYESLVDDTGFNDARTSFVDALKNVGLVSVTNIPFKAKQEALSWIHDCAMESEATQEQKFPDGTVRHTMATHTIPGGAQKIQHNSDKCNKFSQASDDFRKTVASVTDAFASRLNSILDIDEDVMPLLSTENGEHSFSTFADVVENGEHLEHFHSYQRTSQQQDQTIDIHTDQGLFIAFTPGLFVNTKDRTAASTLADGFFIELEDGSRVMVNFNEEDDLVFMLGDGVNQLINPILPSAALRATPHALTMPAHDAEMARVWYGRMVLPPVDAIHPEHKKTFAQIRQELVDASASGSDPADAASLGCSSSMSVRNLQTEECQGDTIYCWFRCMNTTDFGVSDEICAEQGLDMRCINPRSQLYVAGHGDYYPACIDASQAENVTAYPALRELPWDDEVCDESELDSFKTLSSYDHQLNLGNATFLWSVVDGMVDGRFVFNGLFGWLAFGFANVGGSRNGMSGATIIMAVPGGNYSAATGLDLTMDPTVEEYVIDLEQSAFRHWQTPVSSVSRAAVSAKERTVEATECFTAITFKADGIHNKKFNLDGADELIWGANAEDYFVGYHGRQNRGRFAIDWTTGRASVDGVPINQPAGGEGNSAAPKAAATLLTGAALAASLFL